MNEQENPNARPKFSTGLRERAQKKSFLFVIGGLIVAVICGFAFVSVQSAPVGELRSKCQQYLTEDELLINQVRAAVTSGKSQILESWAYDMSGSDLLLNLAISNIRSHLNYLVGKEENLPDGSKLFSMNLAAPAKKITGSFQQISDTLKAEESKPEYGVWQESWVTLNSATTSSDPLGFFDDTSWQLGQAFGKDLARQKLNQSLEKLLDGDKLAALRKNSDVALEGLKELKAICQVATS